MAPRTAKMLLPQVQQPVRSSASPAAPDNNHNVGKVSSPTEYKHIYLFLFEQDPIKCSFVSVETFVHRHGVLNAHKFVDRNIPTLQRGQVADVSGAGGCIYLVTSHSLVLEHRWTHECYR